MKWFLRLNFGLVGLIAPLESGQLLRAEGIFERVRSYSLVLRGCLGMRRTSLTIPLSFVQNSFATRSSTPTSCLN